MAITTYADLIPYMLPDLPGYQAGTALAALRAAGREFCRRSEAWTDDLDPVDLVIGQRDFSLSPVIAGTTYSAAVKRIVLVRMHFGDVDDYAAATDYVTGQVVRDAAGVGKFYFCTDDHTSTGSTIAADLTANPGSWRDYDGYPLDEDDWEFVRPATLRLSANRIPSIAIDTGLTVKAVLVPDQDANDMPSWVLGRYSEAIIGYALHQLLRRRDPDRALYWLGQYNKAVNQAFVDGAKEIGV